MRGLIDRRSAGPLATAALVWWAAVTARWWGPVGLIALGAAGLTVLVLAGDRRRIVAAVLVMMAAGAWSGLGSVAREDAVLAHETPAGSGAWTVKLLTDPRAGYRGWWALAVPDPSEPGRPAGIPFLVAFDSAPPAIAGQKLGVRGSLAPRSGTARGRPYSGALAVSEVVSVAGESGPWWAAGNVVRKRALETLTDRGPARALLAGFLVGEITGIPEADMEAMRRTGLAHLVAVSGSNVTLFLALTLVALGPFAAGPRRRAVLGLVALVVLVVATRFEPSVVRASVMAALFLTGRVAGWALDAATALAVTVVVVVVISGDMATDVGFALSVLATFGVLVGTRFRPPGIPGPVATTLGATVGAQIAVAPVLLSVFGSVPLMAPLTNLVAAPVVVVSTALGALGVAVGVEPVVEAAAAAAGVVLWVARTGAGWPQLGWVGTGAVVVALAASIPRRGRPLVAVVAALAVALALIGSGTSLERPALVVLDVGQGDAILVTGADGATMLVDGGPDAALLERKLAHYRVDVLDLVVLTHVHADHAAGLLAVVGRRPVGELWLPADHHTSSSFEAVVTAAAAYGVKTLPAPVGAVVRLDDIVIEVLGPVRRYAATNDESAVLRIRVGDGPSVLLTGDIETHAQADLVGISADILKVPHQGAATSDLDWLASVQASVAVIPVGPNTYGHPSPEVLAVLEASGAVVWRTDLDGDVVLPLSRAPD